MDYQLKVRLALFLRLIHFQLNRVFYCVWYKFDLDLSIPSNEQAIHKLYKAIHQILLLRLNHTEIACLKTLILFRPGECLTDYFFIFMSITFTSVLWFFIIIINTYNSLGGASCFTLCYRPHITQKHTHTVNCVCSMKWITCFGRYPPFSYVLNQLFSRRLCWLDINIWNCYATRRIAKIAIGIEWRCHTNGSYFIDTAIHSHGCRRSKGYSGNSIQLNCYDYYQPYWFFVEMLWKMSFKLFEESI